MSEETTLSQLTLFAEASHAKICLLPDAGRAWLESEADFGLSSIELLRNLIHSGLSLKMYPACLAQMEDVTLPSSFEGWCNAGMASPIGYLTLGISEFPNAAVECSLSAVLEMDVPPKYFLSAKACRGILRRAERRGKELPEILKRVLACVVMDTMQVKMETEDGI